MTKITVIRVALLASSVACTQSFNFWGTNSAKRRTSLLKAEAEEDSTKFFTTEIADISVPYDATVELAYKLSDQSMDYADFKAKYLSEAVELVKSKQPGAAVVEEPIPEVPKKPVELPRGSPGMEVPYDAAAQLAYESSDSRLGFEDFKKIYLEEAVNLVKSKRKYTRVLPTTPKPKPPGYRPPPPKLVDNRVGDFVAKVEAQKDEYFGAAVEFIKSQATGRETNFEFNPQIQQGVPTETVKGAALLTAGVALLASKGIIVSSAAGITAAVAALQRGVVGDVFRTFGGVTWEAAEASVELAKQATADGKMTGMTKELAASVQGAMNKYQGAEERVRKSQEGTDNVEIAAAEQSFQESSEDLTRILEEAEAAIGQADAAMALADETLGKKNEEEDSFTESEEESSEDEEFVMETEEEEMARLREELRMAQDQVAEDEEKEKEASYGDEDDDEWSATLDMAQQGIDGKIVGIDEVINDDSAKADWDAAGMLAQELQQAGDEETFTSSDDSDLDAADAMLPEGDLEDIARAAREAVAMMNDGEVEEINGSGEVFVEEPEVEEPEVVIPIYRDYSKLTVLKLRDELRSRGLKAYGKKAELIAALEKYDTKAMSESMDIGDKEEESSDDDDDVDFDLGDVDLEELGKQARAAVKAYGGEPEEESSDDDIDLDLGDIDLEELGKQARAAVQAYEGAAEEESSDDDVDFDFDEAALEELGKQARAAVQVFENAEEEKEEDSSDSDVDNMLADLDLEALGKEARAAVDAQMLDEPSDDVLQQLEDEMFEPAKDFTSMTVAQLKDELRSRGLRVSGRKAELIERLQNASSLNSVE